MLTVVKSLGNHQYDEYQKRELLLVDCDCGHRLKIFKRDMDKNHKKDCGVCHEIPRILDSIAIKYLPKKSSVIGFRLKSIEGKLYEREIEIRYINGDEILNNVYLFNGKIDLKGVTFWRNLECVKQKKSGTQEPGEQKMQSKEESALTEKEKGKPMENQKELEKENPTVEIKKASEKETSNTTTNTLRNQVAPMEQTTSEDQFISSRAEKLVSMNLIDESANQLFDVMKSLRVQDPGECKAPDLVKMATEINNNAETVKSIVSCAREIKDLLRLKLDAARFLMKLIRRLLRTC